MILFRYIFMRIFRTFVFGFISVLILITMLNTIELLRRSSNAELSFFELLPMAFLNAPNIALKALPFIMLLSAMWAYISLSRGSEFVAARAAGHTYYRQAFAGMVAAFTIGLFAVFVFGPLSAFSLGVYERLEAERFGGGNSFLSVSGRGVWMREGLEDGHAVMRAARSLNPEGTRYADTSYYSFGEGDVLRRRIDAEETSLVSGAWQMSGVKAYDVPRNLDSPMPAMKQEESLSVVTKLTPDDILSSLSPPETISVWRLPGVIEGMEEAGFSARQHKSQFHALLSLPLFLAAMTLISAAFAIRPPRNTKYGLIALGCALSGFVFYFISDVTMALGASGAAPAALGAWVPALSALLLGGAFSLLFGDA